MERRTPIRIKPDHFFKPSVVKLLQDVVLLVLRLLHIRGDDSYASQLDCRCLVTTIDGEVLIEVTEQPRNRR